MQKLAPDNVDGTTEYGGNVKIMVSKAIGSQLNSGIFSLAPSEALVKDLHQNDEVFYIIDGTLTIDSPGQDTVTAKAGEMVLISKEEVHFSKNIGDQEAKIFWCNIEPWAKESK